jgi:hypothetical protein
MSRLDFHIEQKIAQRDSIDLAAECLAGRTGLILEFGLGKGRSYSHLVERFPGCEIYCFDRLEHTPPGWGPPAERLLLGEIREVLQDPAVHARFTGRVILAHLDVARGDSADPRLHRFIVAAIAPWLVAGAWVLSDRALPLEPAWRLVPVDGAGRVAHDERFYRYTRLAD